ncbi:MAG: hypothetical protein MI923_07865 [Phycisphaerales bacterium]|nr:hypothetical protein [Phycisphaerales bacterium]
MRHFASRTPVICLLIAAALGATQATGEVTNISGSSTATVIQFEGILPVQNDFAQSIVPLTTPEPPAVSRARLGRLRGNDETTAVGQVVSIFELPNLDGLGNPSDLGFNVGAFSDDDVTGWFAQGDASESRIVVFDAAEAGGNVLFGTVASATSRVFLSGVLVVGSFDATKDLSGVEAAFQLELIQRRSGQLPATLLEGEVALTGGPAGSAVIDQASGVFGGTLLPVLEELDDLGDLPVVRMVTFTGAQFPYEYDFTVGQPFELELRSSARVRTTPGGVFAFAIFGLPPDELESIFERSKTSDRGRQLQAMITQHVDTTGQSYVGLRPPQFLLPFCGALGVETIGVLLAGCCLVAVRHRRRARFPTTSEDASLQW